LLFLSEVLDEALIRGRFLQKNWRDIREGRAVECENKHRWTAFLPMLRSEI